ncbi:hypothetical protein CWE08_01030 [Aliidiomarina iranensis]|uniref:Amidase domain-containing protein n=1 Tax=Aliidiomarina iranensis TaxID=1434071 RepID=A0A432W227_9GAMM|nr:amidase [Aliidiomarina iranensis]RUO23267.1 hypothetical protein CWE08_01030 [Aliidiomarina iranensis]
MKFLTANEVARLIQHGELTSAEATEFHLSRIKTLNPSLNAFVYENSTATRAAARNRDLAQINNEPLGLLHGVPISIKECFLWANTPTTLNFPPKRAYQANETSILVKRLLDAGAVILGKTNVPTLLADAQTFGPLYPTANNPFNLDYTPGGSTGGGAAAVAAGLSCFELGSDIGGSIRNPASFCGLFGLKPTENGYASDGHVPPYPEKNIGISVMNHTGPLARSVADLQLAYNVLYQADWQRLRYLPIDTQPSVINPSAEKPLTGCTIGYFDTLMGLQAGSDVQRAMVAMRNKVEAAGAKTVRITIDNDLAERMIKVWATLFGFMLGLNLAWPVRKIFHWKFNPALKASRLPASEELKRGLSLDAQAFSSALAAREQLIAEVNELFSQCDSVLSPTALGPAFPHNHKHHKIMLDGEAIPYLDYCFPFVAFYNLTGHPVLTVPAGLNANGLPVGLSLSAPHHHEQHLFALGAVLEQLGYRFQAPEL